MAAIIKQAKAQEKNSKQQTPIGQIYKKLPNAKSHRNNACVILSNSEQAESAQRPECSVVTTCLSYTVSKL